MTSKTLALSLGLAIGLVFPAAAGQPVLTVYTYDSFASEWGPGPVIEKGFEEVCGCDLEFVGIDSSIGAFNRIRLEGASSKADVLLGLDINIAGEARASGLFAHHGFPMEMLATPVPWTDDTFAPFDWGHFAFVYDSRRMAEAPASFEALLALPDDVKIAIQDPRSSTPGLGLLMWVEAAYGDRAGEIWEALSDNIVTVTPGWSEAYGLFLEGEADMVLSYTTSPAYHLIAEDDTTKAAARFEEGHYLQVEVAGIIASTEEPELARTFLEFMVTDAFQSVIPTTNWMYPAVTPAAGLPEGFETLTVPARALLYSPREAAQARDRAIETWRAALSR